MTGIIAAPSVSATKSIPYVGPSSFGPEDAPIFFGRDREARELKALLISERIVLLCSPSGAGKTSLIQAKLLGQLEKRFRILPLLRLNRTHCKEENVQQVYPNRYVESILRSLGWSGPDAQAKDWPASGNSVETYPELSDFFHLHSPPEGNKPELLIFDQFEEILTLDPTDLKAKKQALQQIGRLLERTSRFADEEERNGTLPARWALFAMREEYLGALRPFMSLIPTNFRTCFRLNLLDHRDACEAIQKPAESKGVIIEKEAAEEIVKDLATVRVWRPGEGLVSVEGPYIEPAQLQIVCLQLWKDLKPKAGDRITREQLKIQGVKKDCQSHVEEALASYYHGVVGEIAANQKMAVTEGQLRSWIDKNLITVRDLRGQIEQDSYAAKELPGMALTALENARLVRQEERNGQKWIELTHDRLIQPIKNDNKEWFEANLQAWQITALAWMRGCCPDSLLLPDTELDKAEQWLAGTQREITRTEEEFLKASQKARELRDAASMRRKQVLWVAAVVVLVLGIIFLIGIVLFLQWKTRVAINAEKKASVAEKVAQANHLAAKALLLERTTPEVGLFAAKKGMEIFLEAKTGISEEDLRKSAPFKAYWRLLLANGGRNLNYLDKENLYQGKSIQHSGPVRKITFTSTHVITTGQDGRVFLWDHNPILKKETWQEKPYQQDQEADILAQTLLTPMINDDFTPILVTTSSNHWVRFWDLQKKSEVDSLTETTLFPKEIYEQTPPLVTELIAFTRKTKGMPDQDWIGAGDSKGTLHLWNLQFSPDIKIFLHIEIPTPEKSPITRLAVNEGTHAGWLVSGSQEGILRFWDLEKVIQFFPQKTKTSDSQTKRILAGEDERGEKGICFRLQGHDSEITDLEFNHKSDGMWLVSASTDQQLRLWNVKRLSEEPLAKYQRMLDDKKKESEDIKKFGFSRGDHTPEPEEEKESGDCDVSLNRPPVSQSTMYRANAELLFAQKFSLIIKAHTKPIVDIAISSKSQFLVTGGMDGKTYYWDWEELKKTYSDLEGQKVFPKIKTIGLEPDGNKVIQIKPPLLRILGFEKNDPAEKTVQHQNLERETGAITDIATSEEEGYIATGDTSGILRLWKVHQENNQDNDQDQLPIEMMKEQKFVTYFPLIKLKLGSAIGQIGFKVLCQDDGKKLFLFAGTADGVTRFWHVDDKILRDTYKWENHFGYQNKIPSLPQMNERYAVIVEQNFSPEFQKKLNQEVKQLTD